MKKSAAVVFLSIVLASSGFGMQVFAADAPVVEEGKGLVVFYRPSRAKGGGIRFNMRGSNGLQHSLLNGTYLTEQLEPGEYTYTVSSPSVDSTDTIVIFVEPAEVYFVRADFVIGWPAWRTKFAKVSEDRGRNEFSKMK